MWIRGNFRTTLPAAALLDGTGHTTVSDTESGCNDSAVRCGVVCSRVVGEAGARCSGDSERGEPHDALRLLRAFAAERSSPPASAPSNRPFIQICTALCTATHQHSAFERTLTPLSSFIMSDEQPAASSSSSSAAAAAAAPASSSSAASAPAPSSAAPAQPALDLLRENKFYNRPPQEFINDVADSTRDYLGRFTLHCREASDDAAPAFACSRSWFSLLSHSPYHAVVCVCSSVSVVMQLTAAMRWRRL